MSGKLPLMKAKEVAKVLEKLGFEFKRQKGSHMFFGHADGRTTVIPNHPTEHVDRGLLNKIIKQDLQMNREEFLKYVK
ncbi:type II toxin-antitoxin system HicA family toxin [Candidatus Woesearchaeota archaeon]|nr:type II toxin-antitoxin system HicA family toxin [Candidatus Woesearchaeota archaeon]